MNLWARWRTWRYRTSPCAYPGCPNVGRPCGVCAMSGNDWTLRCFEHRDWQHPKVAT